MVPFSQINLIKIKLFFVASYQLMECAPATTILLCNNVMLQLFNTVQVRQNSSYNKHRK